MKTIKNILRKAAGIVMLCVAMACGEDESSNPGIVLAPNSLEEISLEASADSVETADQVVLTVRASYDGMEESVRVSKVATFTINEQEISNPWIPDAAGKFVITANYEGKTDTDTVVVEWGKIPVRFDLTAAISYFGGHANGLVNGILEIDEETGDRVISFENLYDNADGAVAHTFADYTAVFRIHPDNSVTYELITVCSAFYIGTTNYGPYDIRSNPGAGTYNPETKTISIGLLGYFSSAYYKGLAPPYGWAYGSGTETLVLTQGTIPNE